MKLVTLWGETAASFNKADANLFSVKKVQTFASLETLLDNNPDLVRFATQERLAKTRVLLQSPVDNLILKFPLVFAILISVMIPRWFFLLMFRWDPHHVLPQRLKRQT